MKGTSGSHGVLPLLSLIIVLFGPVTAGAGGPYFQVGDLYLYLRNYTATDDAIIRIDPSTGGHNVLATYAATNNRTLTYDAYRNRLVFTSSLAPSGLRAIDPNGAIALLAPFVTIPRLVAARGDGIIYLWGGPTVGMRYLDTADAVHDLLNQAGTGPFTFGPGANLDEMIYDPSTNSLIGFVGDFTGVSIPQCTDPHASCAVRIPLTPDGTRVAGAVTAAQVEVSPSFELPVGSGYAPGGAIFWVVDTNSNEREPRMQLVAPATMSLSTFASNGPYIGAAATNAGTYSSGRGQCVTLNPTDHDLRAFSFGEVGDGTRFASGVDPTASTIGRLVEIHTAPVETGVAASSFAGAGATLRSLSANPFELEARLGFSLPIASSSTLAIFDARGRRVRVIADGWFEAGAHDLRWDGRDDSGTAVGAGLYFARLCTGAMAQTLKLTLRR